MTTACIAAPACPLHSQAICPLTTLREALAQHGELTLRHEDLGDLMGATHFPSRTVAMSCHLDPVEWRSTLAHELIHLVRGPVPHTHAAVEEALVRRHAAADLVPVAELRGLARPLDDHEVQIVAARLAERAGVDYGTARDAAHPPTIPIPVVTLDGSAA